MNIKEIASEANLSTATISRAINHPEKVSPETLYRVNKLIDKYNFTPNVVARNLKTDSTQTIALLIPNISNSIYKEIVSGAENIVASKGYSIILCNTKADSHTENSFVDIAIGRQVEGIIVVDSTNDISIARKLERAKTPLVYIGKCNGSSEEDLCYTDFREAAHELSKHLVSLGHSTIDLILPKAPENVGKQIIEGKESITTSGRIHYCDDSVDASYLIIDRLFQKGALPDAVITETEDQAFGIYKAAKELCLTIPDDLAVACMSDSPANAILTPPLTSVYVPAARIGMVAARMLFDSMDSRDGEDQIPQTISLHSKLMIRRSCGNTKDIYEIY